MGQKKKIERLLRKVLLENGEMSEALWDYELAKAVDELYQDIKADGEDYGFAITENRGHIAMVLIMRDKTIYKNEAAREKLAALWPVAYEQNIRRFIPVWAQDLIDGYMVNQGVTTVDTSKT